MGNAVAVMDAPLGRSNAINSGRVLLCGIAAGVVINLSQLYAEA